MKEKEYTVILKDAEKKEEGKNIKGNVICKAKDCINLLYKNYSTSNSEYCQECC